MAVLRIDNMSEIRGFCLLTAFCRGSENAAGIAGVGRGSDPRECRRCAQPVGCVRVVFPGMQKGLKKRLFMRGKVPFLACSDGWKDV